MITGGNFRQHIKQPTPWWSHPLVVGGAVIAVVLINVTAWLRPKATLSADPAGVLDQEIAEITRDVFELQKAVTVASSSAAQEVILRNELLLAKEGEIVVQLPPLSSPLPSPTPTAPHQSIWKEWLNVLQR